MSKKDSGALLNEPAFIFVMDLLLSLCASIISILIIRWLSTPIPGFIYIVFRWMLLSVCATAVSSLLFRTHKMSIEFLTMRSTGFLGYMAGFKAALLYLTMFLVFRISYTFKFKFLLIAFDFLITLTLLVLVRCVIVYFLQKYRRSMDENVVRHRVMVYGISPKSLAQIPRLNDSSYYDLVGIIVTDKEYADRVFYDRKVFCCTSQEDFDVLCAQFGGIESILFARDGDAKDQKDFLISWCLTAGVNVLVSPRIESLSEIPGEEPEKLTDVVTVDPAIHTYKEKVVQGFIPDGMTSFARSMKRLADLTVSTILLIVFSPLFLICFIAIKKEDGGPAFYKQERIGRFGRPFYIYKFRSMRVDAESAGPALYAGDEDSRLTKVGKYLRAHHLDELPQLLNVFKGDMAFVGYRPERQFYIKQIMEKDPRYVYLYQIRPGVTSYATLRNGYADSIDKMVRRLQYDLFYLRHRSWAFDIKILWLTFTNIAFGKKF